jgi:hypothetical protein
LENATHGQLEQTAFEEEEELGCVIHIFKTIHDETLLFDDDYESFLLLFLLFLPSPMATTNNQASLRGVETSRLRGPFVCGIVRVSIWFMD